MEQLRNRLEPWLIWNVVTGIGWAFSGIAALGMVEALGLRAPGAAWFVWVGLTAGTLLALSQLFALQPEARSFSGWIATTVLSIGLGLFVAALLSRLPVQGWGWMVAGGVWGGLIGTAQSRSAYLIKRGRRAWLIRNVTSWSAALGVGAALIDRSSSRIGSEAIDTLVVGILGWVVISLLAGMIIMALSPPKLSREARTRILWLP